MNSPFYKILPVHPALRDWVESVLILDWNYSSTPINNTYTYPWSVTTHIFLKVDDEPLLVKEQGQSSFTTFPSNVIIGPRTTNDIVNHGNSKRIVGIAFKPGGMQRLLGLPVSNLVNTQVDASLIMGSEINELSEKLKNARNAQEIFFFVEGFLLRKLKMIPPTSPFNLAIRELVRSRGNLPIGTVADYLGISLRHFERQSLLHLGISPKLFAKITRFTATSTYKEAHPYISWSQLAYTFGYADQMHLIDDFKRFSGFTPTVLDLRAKESELKLVTALEGKIESCRVCSIEA